MHRSTLGTRVIFAISILFLAFSFGQMSGRQASAQGEDPIAELKSRVKKLEAKLAYVSTGVDANGYPVTTFKACNVQIVNGMGSTNGFPDDPWDPYDDIHGGPAKVNGLGNLIIGYNGKGHYNADHNGGPAINLDVRTGSHNLILGDFNNYSHFGGIVAGDNNTIGGAYASVLGGENNWAGGNRNETVSGGDFNVASGDSCSVSGGYGNQAFGPDASISGGARGLANRSSSSVSGGYGNTAQGPFSSISGGVWNLTTGRNSWVGGGGHNTAAGNPNGNSGASVSGGYGNLASGIFSAVSGGIRNTANGGYGIAINDTYANGQGNWDGVGPTWVAAQFNGY